MSDIEVIQLGEDDTVIPIAIAVHEDPSIVEIDPIRDPGSGGGTELTRHEHYQGTAQSVWLVEHYLDRYPTAWSLHDLGGRLCDEYLVQHMDENVLRVAMDVPSAGIFRCI